MDWSSLDAYKRGVSLDSYDECAFGDRLASRCGNGCGEKLVSGDLQGWNWIKR